MTDTARSSRLREQLANLIERERRSLPEVIAKPSGSGKRDLDDVSWALARARDLVREGKPADWTFCQ